MKKILLDIGKKSKRAFINKIDSKKKDKILKDYCQLIEKNKRLILSENKKDIKNAQRKKIRDNLIDRLILNDKKILNIIYSLKKIIKLKDPVDKILEKWKTPSGLNISKI